MKKRFNIVMDNVAQANAEVLCKSFGCDRSEIIAQALSRYAEYCASEGFISKEDVVNALMLLQQYDHMNKKK